MKLRVRRTERYSSRTCLPEPRSSGFILFFVPEEQQDSLRRELSGLKELPIAIEPQGSKIIYVSGT